MVPKSPQTPPPVAVYIDFAFIVSFLIMIGVGVMQVSTPGKIAFVDVSSEQSLLFVGLGGLCILLAPKIAGSGIFSIPLVRSLVRNVCTEVGVVLGFVTSFLTLEVWPVVILGVAGMTSVVIAMRSGAVGEDSLDG